ALAEAVLHALPHLLGLALQLLRPLLPVAPGEARARTLAGTGVGARTTARLAALEPPRAVRAVEAAQDLVGAEANLGDVRRLRVDEGLPRLLAEPDQLLRRGLAHAEVVGAEVLDPGLDPRRLGAGERSGRRAG